MAEIFLTPEGFKELKQKLEDLKVNRRKEVSEKIQTAREFGDISENAEYDAAKDEQARVEGEINEIEAKLAVAKIIESKDTNMVNIGCTVKLLEMDTGVTGEYKLVGTTESDPSQKKISNEGPVGKAIIGHKKGDVVDVKTPKHTIIKMKIIDIK